MIIQVPGEGSKSSKICLIGEAPGEDECKTRRPFTGASGRLLDRLLGNAGIMRGQCYITNVIKERPPHNDASTFIKFSEKTHKVERMTTAYTEYEQYLQAELLDCQANVFVPLGKVALYALTRLTKITKYRGSILPAMDPLEGRKVLPTLHPAAALRQYLWQYFISRDLRKVAVQAEFPDIRLPERVLEIEPSYSRCMEYLTDVLHNHKLVAYDIEVKNLHVSCISFSTHGAHAICIPFVCNTGDYFTPPQEMDIWRLIAAILEKESITKLCQNGIFDMTFLHRRHGIRVRPLQDTMLAHAILFPEFPKGLDFLCSTMTDEPYYKEDGKFVIKGLSNDDHMFWRYNCKDSAVLHEIHDKEEHMLEAMGNLSTYREYLRTIEPFAYMQERGVAVDTTGLQRANTEVDSRLLELEAQFREQTGSDINYRSPKQLADFYYRTLKYKPYVKRGTGRETTDVDAMKRLVIKGAPGTAALQEIKKWEKLRGTYFRAKLDPDQRLRGSYNPYGTITGRPSSSKTIFQTGLNMLNIPPKMRVFMRADPGYIAFNLDLSQAENRLVAYIAPEPVMIRAFEQGIDIHSQTAAMLHGCRIDEVSNEKGSSPYGNGTLSQRYWGKQCNHSLNYGLGYKAFSYRFELKETQGRELVESYHRLYPGVRNSFHRTVQNNLREHRTLTNLYGGKIRFMGRLDDALFLDAYAWVPQSTVARKINQDGLLYIYENRQEFAPLELLLHTYDSLDFQIPVAIGWPNIAAMVVQIAKNMEKPIQHNTPIVIPSDCKVGTCLGKMQEIGRPSQHNVQELAARLEQIYGEETV